jgi:hypothetical protein
LERSWTGPVPFRIRRPVYSPGDMSQPFARHKARHTSTATRLPNRFTSLTGAMRPFARCSSLARGIDRPSEGRLACARRPPRARLRARATAGRFVNQDMYQSGRVTCDILSRLKTRASPRCWPGRSILKVGSLRFTGQSASGSATKPLLVSCRGLRVT